MIRGLSPVGASAEGALTRDALASGPLVTGLLVVGLLAFGAASLAAFLWRRRRRRDFTHGLRGQAAVVDVQPTSALQRRSVAEAPTEAVVVATADVPRGVRTDQKFPRGTFAPGQIVPVVQRPGHPHRLLVDVPGQAPSAFDVYGFLFGVVASVAGLVYVLAVRA
jgi:hypothetical protein